MIISNGWLSVRCLSFGMVVQFKEQKPRHTIDLDMPCLQNGALCSLSAFKHYLQNLLHGFNVVSDLLVYVV